MEKDLLKIISHYGINNQLKKINEEFYELTEAIINYQNDYYYMAEKEELEFAKNHIVEEMADVFVMLLQFKEYYHLDGKDIMRIMKEKIDRQLKRIKENQ